jgi:hypothetical protein
VKQLIDSGSGPLPGGDDCQQFDVVCPNRSSYDNSLDNDSDLSVLQENEALNLSQINAVIGNGLALDPDGNGTGVIQAIPGSSCLIMIFFRLAVAIRRRR